jgi:transposase
MRVQLDGNAQELLGKSELVIITERVDDVVLLIGQMIKMGLVEALDKHIPRHWNQRGLSWGWTTVVWLAHILSEGDHRKVTMEAYVRGMKETLKQTTGQCIEALDFSDDRLAHLLKNLSKRNYWHGIEQELNERSIEVYDLAREVVRCDATTVSGDHQVKEGGLMQFGHSKDAPSRGQLKVMLGSLDPLGMPLASDVVSGEQADDRLYVPLIARIRADLKQTGLLFVGDCKMSALESRSYVAQHEHFYLSPLPLTGTTAEEMSGWISEGIGKDKAGELELIWRTNDRGQEVLAASGYEFERCCSPGAEAQQEDWNERVLVVHSPSHAQQQAAGLEKRLATAQDKIRALTPARGRGKRQITAEAVLLEAIAEVLKKHRVEGLLRVDFERQSEPQTRYVGRGRGAVNRPQQVTERVRYQITEVVREQGKIAELIERFGWKAFVTNTAQERLSLAAAVLCYRNEYRVERIFNRLKSRLNIAPLFVQRDDQIEGLTYLLTLGARVLTLMEFVVRRSVQQAGTQLPDLHPENRQKTTDKPTAERILKAFSGISLTIITTPVGNEIRRWLTPLSALQQDILRRLGLDTFLYQQLEI